MYNCREIFYYIFVIFMKKLLKPLISVGIVVFCGLISLTLAQVISSRNSKHNNVPDYYYANYKFADDWEGIIKWFNTVKAKYSVDEDIPPSEFAELAKHFDVVFPNLTKDFSVDYEKCSLLAHRMAKGYSKEELEAFMWNTCYRSLMQRINTINSSYTVRPSVSVNPSSWKVPLTVTFNARGSTDPSAETLPIAESYRYYRDVDKVDTPMWEGQVINYTFDKPWKYIVHFVARSSNVDEWILDWEQNIEINVNSKAANIVVYANTRKMSEDWPLKIWTTEWEKWVVFDGSLTMPVWWNERKIMSHRWTIVNNWNTVYDSKVLEWYPKYINVPLKWSWLFKVTLSTWDNETNQASETYELYLSDPVAIIKQTPSDWTTSTTFNFDGSASYSITNKLDTYYWEVFDANWWDTHGDVVKWSYDKKISINFSDLKKKPWNYLVRLTITDIKWNKNEETQELYVESTPPKPQFIVVPTKIWTYPSEFTLDATSSMDIDMENRVDSLEYSWSFSKPGDVSIISTENNNEKMVVRFNSVGKHTITLTATDEYGVSTKISKDVEIKSVLRPEIKAIPWVITWKQSMKFESSVNYDSEDIYEYDWDFGDGTNNAGQFFTKAKHNYSWKWIYTVTLRVTDKEGHRNEVKERVFVWEEGSPIAAFKIKDNNWYFIQATEQCEVESWWNIEIIDAYPVDRYDKFTIDPSYSVNTKWRLDWLKFAFAKQGIMWIDKAKTTGQLTENFSELWCHYVSLEVYDPNATVNNQTVHETIWFKVNNALPKLNTITLSYPQYEGNENFVWFWDVNTNRMSFDCSWTSNLMVKVTAVSPEDPDWSISRMRFYYYNVDDPDRKLESKDTWLNAPYVYFSIPRVWWEYKFWVFLYDNDWWMIDSDEYLASNPSIYFPASCSDSDIPTVTLKVSPQNIQVWDEVKYEIISKLSTNNEDFLVDRTFYYDFTWDWVRDLITKKDTVTYQFLEEYDEWVVPRAAVEYRRKLWIASWATIYVKNGLKPIFMYNSIWNTVIFRDLSVWVIKKREICFESSECEKWNMRYEEKSEFAGNNEELTWWTKTEITEKNVFMKKYNWYWLHNISFHLMNRYWNEVWTWFTVKTSNNQDNGLIAPWVNMITIPEMTMQNIKDPETWKIKDSRAEIFLAKNMDNMLLMYVYSQNEWTCFVDTDIATDSDWDGDATNDAVLLCNKMAKISYEPNYENVIWRVYFMMKDESWKDTLTFKNFYVGFDWYGVPELSAENLEIYNDINILMNGLDDSYVGNTTLKGYLDKLRRNLNNSSEVAALVIEINSQMETLSLKMDSKQKERLDSILARLSSPDTVVDVSVWMNNYERNKQEILALLPTEKWSNVKDEIVKMFADFEANVTSYWLEERENVLNDIWDKILNDYKKNKYWDADFYTQYFCGIFDYYDIVSNKCGINMELKNIQKNYEDKKDDAQATWDNSGWLPMWLKILLIILLWWVLTMVWLIVFFSIKAKLSSSSENDWDEW